MPSSATTKGTQDLMSGCRRRQGPGESRLTVRFTYNGPTTLAWRQEKGELKSVDGRWELEDLGGNRTRATYSLEVDLEPHAQPCDSRPAGGPVAGKCS